MKSGDLPSIKVGPGVSSGTPIVATTASAFSRGRHLAQKRSRNDRVAMINLGLSRCPLKRGLRASEGQSNVTERATTFAPWSFSFGPFVLIPEQQLLVEGKTPVRIGSRVLEILVALVERPGELVSKDELLSRAWPGILVEESNLRSMSLYFDERLRKDQAAADT